MGFVKWRPEKPAFVAIDYRGTIIFSSECLKLWHLGKNKNAEIYLDEEKNSIGLKDLAKKEEHSIPIQMDSSRYTGRCHCRAALAKMGFALPESGSRRYPVRLWDGLLVVELSQELPKPVRKKLRVTE